MQALPGRQQTTHDSSRKRKYSNRPPCGVNTFPLKRSAEIVQLTSKFVWTGAWLTLLFKEDSIMPRIHKHDSNTHNAHTYLLQLTSKFVWTVFGRSCALSKMIFTPAHHPAGYTARDGHRPSQHHPYDLALFLSLPPLSVRPGPTRPDLDPGPTSTTPSTGPARPGLTRSQD